MAAPGFGFSVGDFIAGVSLVKKLVRAINDTAGSRPAYRRLISELLNLEDALQSVTSLQLGPGQQPQRLTLQRVAAQCQTSIETFISKNAKFSQSLGLQPSAEVPTWRVNLHKIQWALCKDKAVDELRTEIASHLATLNLNLTTIQVSNTRLQEKNTDNCMDLVQAVFDETRKASARAEENQQTLVAHTGLIETISRAITGLVSGQQDSGLLSVANKVIQWNIRIFDVVTQLQQTLCSLPPQVERQQPVLFEDAHGRLAPFHVEFINSCAAFQAVLEARFDNMPGLGKVKRLEYAMQDAQSKRILDLSSSWETHVRPGRKFVMSMIFQTNEAVTSRCPACYTDSSSPTNVVTDIQCENSDCRMMFRCLKATECVKVAKRKRSESSGSSAKRQKFGHSKGATHQDDAEEIHEFRRVQIVQIVQLIPEARVTQIPAQMREIARASDFLDHRRTKHVELDPGKSQVINDFRDLKSRSPDPDPLPDSSDVSDEEYREAIRRQRTYKQQKRRSKSGMGKRIMMGERSDSDHEDLRHSLDYADYDRVWAGQLGGQKRGRRIGFY